MSYSNETLWLVVAPKKRGYRSLRISRISKKRPTVKLGEGLLQLNINLPDDVLSPPRINVEVKREHLAPAQATVEAVRQS